MKKQILIKTKSKKYKIVIENGSINTYLKSELKSDSKKFFIVDSKVSKKINKIINNKKNVFLITVKGSEKLKSINSYWKIISNLLQKKIDVRCQCDSSTGLNYRASSELNQQTSIATFKTHD